jgi:LytS/YehU family sensor histidine kinase
MFITDHSILYYVLSNSGIEYMILCTAQCIVIARRYERAQQMELALLKSQIRPHFVHNALTTIISVSRKDGERARELLKDFSSYLRGFYDYESDELVPIDQELEFIRAYVALEQARFGDRVQVEYRIEVSDALLPPLILQPCW